MLSSLLLLTSLFFIISLASTDYQQYISFHWKGALTSNSIIIKAFPKPTLLYENMQILLVYYQKPVGSFNSSQIIPVALTPHPYPVVQISLNGLTPMTTYYYSFIFYQGPAPNATEVMQVYQSLTMIEFHFKTFGIALMPFNFSFGAASCAKTGSTHEVFNHMANSNLDFFIHMGDLHYEDIDFNDEVYYYGGYAEVFGSSTQKNFFQKVPLFYIWDDHDFGVNNADGDSYSKHAATIAYKRYAPYGQLRNAFPADDSSVFPGSPAGNTTYSNYTTGYQTNGSFGIYRSFIAGRCLFIILDLRTWKDVIDYEILGAEQLTWLENQLKFASITTNIAMVVIVSTLEWINTHKYNWGYYREHSIIGGWIDNYINSKGKQVVWVGGDSHMIALDDGTNNPAGGSLVIQAASMDRQGSCKGGPYSHGIEMGAGHFGVMTVTDYTDKICLKVSLKYLSKEVIAYDTCNKNSYPAISGSDTCFKAYVRYYLWLIIIGCVAVFLLLVLVVYLVWRHKKNKRETPPESLHPENLTPTVLPTSSPSEQ